MNRRLAVSGYAVRKGTKRSAETESARRNLRSEITDPISHVMTVAKVAIAVTTKHVAARIGRRQKSTAAVALGGVSVITAARPLSLS